MSRHWRLLLCWAALLPGTAVAQGVVTSAAPDRVAVTVYRDPNRAAATAPDLSWLNGYALITETRQVSIPAGESTIRFEGVAGGILPQSAIVAGFPEGIVERNRDAYLLSPATLVDRSLGQRVHLRRTSTATGAVREQEAVVRSGADGAVVLQTAEGFEALRCTGLAETLVFDGVPEGLTARPTLSVRTRASQPVTATITLSYLASGFDWQANYIAYLSADGNRVDLFAWLTLASNDETNFVNADTQAVAGRLNREDAERGEREGGPLNLRCWPQAEPIVVAEDEIELQQANVAEELLRELPGAEAIVVTGAMIAQRENLGDLKLYRIPEPVTVAANSQKQVALLEQRGVRAALVYRQRLDPDGDSGSPEPSIRYLVTRNREAEGLGIPLPAGGVVLFATGAGRPVLIGEGSLDDRAVGDDVEIRLDEALGVRTTVEQLGEDEEQDRWRDYQLIVTNDQTVPVSFEAEFAVDDDDDLRPQSRLSRRNGRPLWAATVPANGRATLRYRIVERRSED